MSDVKFTENRAIFADRFSIRLKAIIITLLVLFVAIAVKNAWLSDDAYITFRTIDNFVSGYGLTYNVLERVQAYTHPLWMFLLSVFYVVTSEVYYTSIILSLAITLIALLLLVRLAADPQKAILGIVLLICSKAFVDYTTSGLENPLSHLLLPAFVFFLVRPGEDTKRLILLSLIAALAALNRLDSLLLYLPPLAYHSCRVRSWKAVGNVALGFLPLIAWTGFSLLYYGAPFPNTAYAKLSTGVNSTRLAIQGLYYFTDSFTVDPLTLLTILAGLALTFRHRRKDEMAVAIGVLLYLIYIIKIGGDFMSGRFLSLPFLAAVILISRSDLKLGRVKLRVIYVAVIILSLVSAKLHLLSGSDCGAVPLTPAPGSAAAPVSLINENGICDERAFYYQATGFLCRERSGMVNHQWARDGMKMRNGGPAVIVKDNLGFFGFYAGKQDHIIDLLGLVDPLLSRLPVLPWLQWRIGHFSRELPKGYVESLQEGRNLLEDKNLAAYYDIIVLITRKPLFERGRLAAIWKLNTGGYDYLIDAYVRGRLTMPAASDR